MHRTLLILGSTVAAVAVASPIVGHFRPHRVSAARPAAVKLDESPTAPAGVAAQVNDQVIPLSQVSDMALRVAGAGVVDQLVGQIVIHQEAVRRNLTATDSEIDQRVDAVRDAVKPHTLDDVLKARHMTMDDFRDQMRSEVEVHKLIAGRLLQVKMVHIRQIFVPVALPGETGTPSHTAAQAQKIMATVQAKLKAGAPFDQLAAQYSDDPASKGNGGDLGIISNVPTSIQNPMAHQLAMQPEFLKACLALHTGQTSASPVRTRFGLHLLQAVSTGDDPQPGEAALYNDALNAAMDDQMTRLAPVYVDSLTKADKVEVYLGKTTSGPAGVAATVNGENIPLSHVAAIALGAVGPGLTQTLIDNALVDQEAAKRHVVITGAQIDGQIDQIRKRTAPRKLEDVLRDGRMTMAEMRESQRVKLEAEAMVAQSIGQFQAAHIRDIDLAIKTDPSMVVGRPEAQDKALMAAIQRRLKAGARFPDLAKAYCDNPLLKSRSGDLGIVTAGDATDPALLTPALALAKGQVVPGPVKAGLEMHLFEAVSTLQDHPKSEDTLYRMAEQNAKAHAVQNGMGAFMAGLRKNAHVVDYLGSGA